MNTFTHALTKVLQGALLATPLLLGAVSAEAATNVCQATHKSSLDARLVAKSDQGAAPLRQFVERTQTVHQLDVDGAQTRANRTRKADAQCKVATASR